MNTTVYANLQAEQEVLGAILIKNDNLIEVIDILDTQDFFSEKHRLLYEAMKALYAQEKPIDITTLMDYFRNDLSSIGGFSYLTNLINSAVTFNKQHVNIIKEKSHARTLQHLLIKSLKDLETKPFKEVLIELQDKSLNIDTIEQNYFVNDVELMTKTMDMIQANYERGGGIIGISTGIKAIDTAINGLQKKKLYVIAGRPGMGKSALAINICQNVSKTHKVDYYSLEMSEEELGLRRLAMTALIDSAKIERGQLTEKEWLRVTQKMSEISKNGCITNCKPKIHINSIRAQAKKRKLQGGLDLIIVDHLGLMDYTGMGDTLREQTSKVCEELKNIAKEFDIPVIILSQLNRGVEQRADKRPMLSDLKETSGIEENADVVMLLYRDEYYNKQTADKNIIECNIAKQRGGRTGVVRLAWMGDYQKIADIYKEG